MSLAPLLRTVATGLGFALCAAPAFAWTQNYAPQGGVPVYSYNASANFCPAGLQPVTIGGVICCGSPNAGSYQSMMRHPAPRRVVTHAPPAPRRARVVCPVGQKGCHTQY